MAGWNIYQQFPQTQNFQQQNNNNVWAVPVQSEESVGMYPVAMGNTAILYNPSFTKIWLKSTDFNGFPQPIRAFDVVEVKQKEKNSVVSEQFVTQKEFEELQKNLNNNFNTLIERIEMLTKGDNTNNATANNAVITESTTVPKTV